jgi:hypothetical protein
MARAALSRILSQLHGCTQTKPDQWQAKCPYHKSGDEENASFGVTIHDDGRILLNCFRGCRPEHYWPILGITNADVAPDSLPRLHDPARPPRRDDRVPPEEWEVRCAAWAEFFAKSSAARSTLAQALTLPESVLEQLPGVGVWNDHKKGPCWTFPERDAQGRIVGVGLRFRNGDKPSAPGSARGLSLPLGWKERSGPLYLVEGPSDTLAMTAAGLAAIGRPSNVGGVKLLAELIRAEVPAERRLIWLGENDRKANGEWPGKDDSRKAAAKLVAELGRTVEFGMPPNATEKDMRAWFTGLVLDGCQWEEMPDRVEKFLKTVPIAPTGKVPPPPAPAEGDRVVVSLDTNNEKTVNDAVIDVISESPVLFVRGPSIVTLACVGAHAQRGCHFPPLPHVIEVSAASLQERMSEMIDFRQTKRNKEVMAHPPSWCVNAVHDRGSWPKMKYLEAIVEYPVVRPDGSLLATPGYDESTGVYYNPIGAAPVLPDALDRTDAERAWDTLTEVVCDFPFKDAGKHRSAWLAALLTPLARFAFRGAAPIFLVDANAPGIGKGLLCDTISIPLTGQEFATTSYSKDDEEMRKKITTLALRGTRLVLLDNISGDFGGPAIDQALTTVIWEDRLLGGNTSVSIPLRATWFGTGNNVQVRGDMLRRVCHVRLETDLEKPEERTGFRQAKLRRWMKDNQGVLLGAALTILLAYFRAGRPKQKMSEWGGYEEWSEVVRGAIVWLGLPDPAETKREMREASDVAISSMQFLLESWGLLDKKRKGITANQIIAAAFPKESRDADSSLDDVAEAIAGMTSRPTGQQLSTRFRQFRGRTLGNYYLDSFSKHGRVIRWGVFDARTRMACFPVPKPSSREDGEDGDGSASSGPGTPPLGNKEKEFSDGYGESHHHPHRPHPNGTSDSKFSDLDND